MLISCIYSAERFASFSFAASSSPSSSPCGNLISHFPLRTVLPISCLSLSAPFPLLLLLLLLLPAADMGVQLFDQKPISICAYLGKVYFATGAEYVELQIDLTPGSPLSPIPVLLQQLPFVFVVANRFSQHFIKFSRLYHSRSHSAAVADNRVLRFAIRVA